MKSSTILISALMLFMLTGIPITLYAAPFDLGNIVQVVYNQSEEDIEVGVDLGSLTNPQDTAPGTISLAPFVVGTGWEDLSLAYFALDRDPQNGFYDLYFSTTNPVQPEFLPPAWNSTQGAMARVVEYYATLPLEAGDATKVHGDSLYFASYNEKLAGGTFGALLGYIEGEMELSALTNGPVTMYIYNVLFDGPGGIFGELQPGNDFDFVASMRLNPDGSTEANPTTGIYTTPQTSETVEDSTYLITGYVIPEPGMTVSTVQVSLNGGNWSPATLTVDTNWEANVSLDSGENTFQVRVNQDNSKVFESSATVTYEPPAATATLDDVIRNLQVASGIQPIAGVDLTEDDRNEDGRIGLEDAVYNLQVIAGDRP